MAAETADVVCAARSFVQIFTRWPASASRMAELKPMTPLPKTKISMR